MKKVTLMIGTVLASSFTMASIFSKPVSYTCSGSAEYGKYKIENLVLSPKKITLTYTEADGTKVNRDYFTLNFMKKNAALTDTNAQAYIIDGSKSGRANDYDDISLPHFGIYKTGLGSEIAFESKAGRVFGTVNCVKK